MAGQSSATTGLERRAEKDVQFLMEESLKDIFIVKDVTLDRQTLKVVAKVTCVSDGSEWEQCASFKDGRFIFYGPDWVKRNGVAVRFDERDWIPAMRMDSVFVALMTNS